MFDGERRLAAIMFTDLVGYTALAQEDERGAMGTLETHNKLLRPVFARYKGHEVKTIGDAFLVEFESALAATECAIEIQDAIAESNRGNGDGKPILVRIGIHVGDVIHRGGDIFGDAVNIASRVEPLADPGGICVSEQVYAQVRNKISWRFEKLEGKTLKNVNVPVEVYRMVMPGEAAVTELDRRRVAVLPLQNMSPDPLDEYFADGMTEELITTLASVKGLTVIARTSVMQYKKAPKKVVEIGKELSAGTLLEGSVRKSGNKVRITLQLIDARDDGHLWVQNYDKQLDDVFAIQTEVAEKVADALRVKLLESERSRLENRRELSAGPYTLYLKGLHYWNERTKAGLEKAIQYFKAATAEDPRFAKAYAALGDCYEVMAKNGQMDPNEGLRKAYLYALKALGLDEKEGETHILLASTILFLERNPAKAGETYRRGLELSPSFATGHQRYAQFLAFTGHLEQGLAEVQRASELDPLSPVLKVNIGDGLYYLNRFDEAERQFKKVIEEHPGFAIVYPSLIQLYVRTSMQKEALGALDALAGLGDDEMHLKILRACIYAKDRPEEARRIMSEVERSDATPLTPYGIAIVYFLMGDNDAGFHWLEDAYNRFDGNLYSMKIDYELDGVRSDPRYLSLLERLGFTFSGRFTAID